MPLFWKKPNQDPDDFVITKESTKINVGSFKELADQYVALENNLPKLKNIKGADSLYDDAYNLWKQTADIYKKISNNESVDVKIYETTKQFEIMNSRITDAVDKFHRFKKYRAIAIILVIVIVLIVLIVLFFVIILPKLNETKSIV